MTGIPEADRNGIRTAASYDNPSLTKYSTNWQNEIFRTAPIRNYEIAISGGNDRTQYSISGGYFDQDGIVRNSGFTRLHGRLNLDHSVSSKFKVGTGIGLTRSTVNRLENDNNIYGVISTAILATSDVPIRDDKGRYYKDPASIVENPVAAFAEPTQLVTNYRVLANAYAQYELIKGLTFRSQIGTDYLTSNEDQYKPTTTNAGVGVKGQGTSTSYTATRWQWDNIMNYSTTIAGKHNINATAVAAYEERNQATLYIQTTGFPSNDFKKNVSGSVKVDAQSNGTSIGISSYVGRLNYDYDGKYLFSASARYDGASNLGKNYRWGLFPSVSGGWLISEENL
ncbi:hypothetical protein ACFFJX_20245 [Pseudarcicella hirudinis]|uniref:hypothetical protein n=1 Tax=Pseudarcicella hirudinis TaxID=1079859 RepID=UPI0035E4F794